MAKFLNTSAINYFLEELIKGASERLILISPFLKINDRIKELLEDKNRLKIDVRLVYGKNELQPEEINWLRELSFIRTSFCKNLHAKCYLNEEGCIITSLNLYEFSQINNNEMGVFFSRSEDVEVYRETYEEAQRIIRISDEVRMSLEKVSKDLPIKALKKVKIKEKELDVSPEESIPGEKLTSYKFAKKLGISTQELLGKLVECGYLEEKEDKHFITESGKTAGGEFRMGKFGPYFLWPESLSLAGIS
ncbi:MAG: phospholipase D family protein [Cyanobacteria bacterium]|nr:phospholipase D family protein [Cyanobacteriota bacterium]